MGTLWWDRIEEGVGGGGKPRTNRRIDLIMDKKPDFILPKATTKKGGRNPMREIQIDLTIRFKMPKRGLNVNGVLMGLRRQQVFFDPPDLYPKTFL